MWEGWHSYLLQIQQRKAARWVRNAKKKSSIQFIFVPVKLPVFLTESKWGLCLDTQPEE